MSNANCFSSYFNERNVLSCCYNDIRYFLNILKYILLCFENIYLFGLTIDCYVLVFSGIANLQGYVFVQSYTTRRHNEATIKKFICRSRHSSVNISNCNSQSAFLDNYRKNQHFRYRFRST